MLCAKCNKNLAVVFVTKVDKDGNQLNEGYCLTCAKKMNIGPVNDIMEKMGINPEEMDGLNHEMTEMLNELGGEDGLNLEDGMEMFKNGFSLTNFFDSDEHDENSDTSQDEESSEKETEKKSPFSIFSNIMNVPKPKETEENKKEKEKDNTNKNKKKKRKFLDLYGINITERAKNGGIDRVVGRDIEMARVAQILNRRTKNNPVLIGEPGVGKTAVAEGLALKIVEGDVPAKLLNYEIYIVDMTAMVAGTQFRGQFESRLKNLIDEVKRLGNIILVIDEVHTIATAGDAEGAMSAGNILKPALSKGEIQIIGATTLDEYRKHIEKDSALERRFQPIIIEEPSVDETIEILKGIKNYYEDYHKVKITDDIIRTAAVLSERYITDRFLPDKAIDVIDEAASRVNLKNTALVELEKLKNELLSVQGEIESEKSPEGNYDYQKMADLRSRECKIEEEIEKIEKNSKDIYLQPGDLAAVIEGWTKIPVSHITEFETNKLINLEERLHERVIGQNDAVSSVARAIRRKRAGISLRRRPISFIFVGPTGVGKTELVKQIAREVFDSEDALIRLDMSEYMEKHSASKLIGSPPGYVGYDDAGQLTEKIRRRPYSVILMDEIEKAHPDVFNMLLQILDDGRISDSHGKVVSFENTIIIMTSNAGSDRNSGIAGFSENDNSLNERRAERALKEIFRPEFLNRIDEIIVFKELTKTELLDIISIMLSELNEGLSERGISMDVTISAKELILERAYSKTYGARPLRRYIEKNIEDKLAQMLIQNELKKGSSVIVDRNNDEITVTLT